jgi:hypothetical protein
MATAKQPPGLHFYIWVTANSSYVLGHGRTAEAAFKNAYQRYGEAARAGYPTTVTLSHMPPGSNPLIAVAHAFKTGGLPLPQARPEPAPEAPRKRARRKKASPRPAEGEADVLPIEKKAQEG